MTSVLVQMNLTVYNGIYFIPGPVSLCALVLSAGSVQYTDCQYADG